MTVTDQRLFSTRDALTTGRHTFLSVDVFDLSVDVFDTLIWRRVPEPSDVFLQLGQRLQSSRHMASHISPVVFADLRRSAQTTARELAFATSGSREVTLADIYTELPDTIFADTFTEDERVSAEIDCERSLMILDEEIVALMRHAKESGVPVIFVSDTYFSSQNINDFLRSSGFRYEDLIDRLYVSCEAGRPKFLDLFDVILKELGLAPGELIHIGDNPDADIHPCRSRGIACVHYDKWSFSPRVQSREFPSDRPGRMALLGGSGDHGLTGLRSRLYHRPPQDLNDPLLPYWRYGASVLGPGFAGFARWLADTCQVSGAKRIFGIMREGRFLGLAVEAAAEKLGVDLVAEELWLSRRAVIRAALFPDDLTLLSEAVSLSPGNTKEEVLLGLGLSVTDLDAVFSAPFDWNGPNAITALSQTIVQTPALREKVLEHSAQLRRNLLTALGKQIDLGQAADVFLMDLGYAATIQTVLLPILAREGTRIKLRGLYLALNSKAAANLAAGADIRAYLDHEGFHGPTATLLSRTPDVLEHACMCREGSLADYDETGGPILLPNLREEAQLSQMEAVQDGILAGLGSANDLLGDLGATPADDLYLKKQIAEIIKAALLYPTRQDAETIGTWHHEANFDLLDQRRLTDLAVDTAALEYQGWPELQDLTRAHVYWPSAALMRANTFLNDIFAAGSSSPRDTSQVTSGPMLGGLAICPDLGVGFDAKHEGTVPLTINVFGRGEISIEIKPLGPLVYQRLRLRFPQATAFLSVDELAITYKGEHDRKTLVLSEGNGLDRLNWKNVEHSAPGTVTAASEGAEATVDLSHGTPPWLHGMHLRLRYKYLRLERLFQ